MLKKILLFLIFILSLIMLLLSIATSHDVHEFYHEASQFFLILGLVGVIRHGN